MIQPRINDLAALLATLLAAPAVRVGDLLASASPAADVPGVYLISQGSDPSTMVYVGRTKTKSVLGRLKDHRRMKTGSDLAGMLARHAAFPQQADDYHLRWIPICDSLERAQFELFAIAVLSPPFNRYI